MRKTLLTLCLVLPVLGQPLPLAWPDRPEGTVLYAINPFSYGGSSAPGGEGELIVAWCDMRDGYGRVMVQKVSTEDPATPGQWFCEVEDLGPVAALAMPTCDVSPYKPWLVPDGDGGAIVVWQDRSAVNASRLLAMRVGDGPGGVGALLWPEPLQIAADVAVPHEGSRVDMSDDYKGICADDSGGAWVIWRDLQGESFIQHVTAEGSLDSDFPAEGLPLPALSHNFQVVPDGAGNGLIFFAPYDGQSAPLRVMGVRQDASFILPQTSRVVSSANTLAFEFNCQSLGGGRVLAGWVHHAANQHPGTARLQLLDSNLQDLWTTGGVLLGETAYASPILCAGAGPQGPYLASFNTETDRVAQLLDEQGNPQWGGGAILDLGEGEAVERVLSIESIDGEWVYLMIHDSELHMQRLTGEGAQQWSLETSRLSGPGQSLVRAALQPDGTGGALCAWSEIGGSDLILRTQRLTATGQPLLTAGGHGLLRGRMGNGYRPILASGSGDPLFIWYDGRGALAQSVNAEAGWLRWGYQDRPLEDSGAGIVEDVVEVEDGAWLLLRATGTFGGEYCLGVQKLSLDGQTLTPLWLVTPGADGQEGFFSLENGRLALADDHIYVAYEEYLSVLPDKLVVQCLTESGVPLWGDLGIAVGPPGDGWRFLSSIAPAGNGGVDLVFTENESGSNACYLQHFGLTGTPTYPENDGRGLLSTLQFASWDHTVDVLPLSNGGRLLSHLPSGMSLQLDAFNSAGERLWARQVDDPSMQDVLLSEAPNGAVWLLLELSSAGHSRLMLERLAAGGEPEQFWLSPDLPVDWLDDWQLVFGQDQVAVVTVGARLNQLPGVQVSGYLVDEDTELLQLLFNAPLLDKPFETPASLAPAPNGDLWITWGDKRGVWQGQSYGAQARLNRLDVLDLNTGVDPLPEAPVAFTLQQNQPNPFNPETWIAFDLDQPGPARLEVFNLAGQRVRVLQDGSLTAGSHRLRFDARDDAGRELGSGLYFYRLNFAGQSRTARMLLVR